MKTFFTFLFALALAGCEAWGFIPITAPTLPATSSPIPTRQPTNTARPAGAAARLSPTPGAAYCLVANTEGEVLNVRSAESLKAPILGGLVPGQRVTVLSAGDAWLFITTGDLTGYIYSKYCEVTNGVER